MMSYLISITLIGLLSGIVGTGLGGIFVISIKSFKEQALAVLLAFAAGVMTVIIFLELIPESLETGTLLTAILGILLGVSLIFLLDVRFPHHHFLPKTGQEATPQMLAKSKLLKTGILLGIGVALHNVPEGIAIGAGFIAGQNIGFGLALLIALHNLPEGMAVATALGLAGLNRTRIIIYTTMAGIPMGVGAFLGGFFGSISPLFLSLALGFAGGAMLYIVYDELIPDAHSRTTGQTAIIGIVLGVIVGIALIQFLH
ncbi:MAG: ZIP family metal transporter [Bacillota bacterium]